MSNIVLPINEEEYQRDCQLMYEKGKADRDREIAEGNVFFSNRPVEDIALEAIVEGYNQALEDVWNEWLECDLDFETFNAWLCEKMQGN